MEPVQIKQFATIGLIISLSIAIIGFGFVLWFFYRLRRNELGDDEIARRRNERILERALRTEAAWLVRRIPRYLALQHQFDHVEVNQANRRRRRHQFVKFDWVGITKTAIWLHIPGHGLPYGTSFWDIKNPERRVVEGLQNSLRRPVKLIETSEYDFFVVVGLPHAYMGVPKLVHWAEMVATLPASRPFAIPIGVNESNKLIYQDVTAFPHALIMGGTGMGKSIMAKQLIATLVSRNAPAALQLCLIDLKRVELHQFRGLPHVSHYVDRPENVSDFFAWLKAEMNRRLDSFVGTCEDIRGWNAQHRNNPLNRIVVLIDELATLTTDRELKRDAIDYIVDFARLGRAAGIHLILCTQTVAKEVLPMNVLANIDGRICFSVRSSAASVLAVGNGSALGLDLPGRLVFIHGSKQVFLQAPLITNENIAAVIAAAGVEPTPRVPPPSELDIFKVIHYNLGGRAAWQEVMDAINGSVGEKRLKRLLTDFTFDPAEQKPIIEFDEQQFILTPPFQHRSGRIPRYLLAVEAVPATLEETKRLALGQGQREEKKQIGDMA